MNKKQNLPILKMFDEIIEGGEKKCKFLVETVSAVQPFSPESVCSELIHSVALNMSDS